ncbi:MAG: AmpG family muropeptide MFS transporter [Thermodesulfovibrionales bacterium]
MDSELSTYLQVFKNRRIVVMVLLGFSSGLPISLTAATLQAWMTVAGVDLRTIGVFGLVGLPYILKFLWSPFMDRYAPPLLGRRRGWIVLTQLSLVGGISTMAFGSPANAPWTLAALSLLVAFTSASQDIVVDAYRTDVLHETERGAGVAVFVTGYRIAMLVSGALAFILSDLIGWRSTYLLMAALMSVGIGAAFFGPEPERSVVPPQSLREAVWGPLKDFFSRRAAFMILLLIVLYKLADAYAGAMTTPFLIRGLGFSATDVGTVNKAFGLAASIVGITLGGALMVKLGLFRSLLAFGILQAVSILSFVLLALAGKSYAIMIICIALENFTAGMGTAAFLSLLMGLCNQRFSATQYALLSSLAAAGRIFIAPTSGYVAATTGWPAFFLISALAGIPGLLLLWRLRADISALHRETA